MLTFAWSHSGALPLDGLTDDAVIAVVTNAGSPPLRLPTHAPSLMSVPLAVVLATRFARDMPAPDWVSGASCVCLVAGVAGGASRSTAFTSTRHGARSLDPLRTSLRLSNGVFRLVCVSTDRGEKYRELREAMAEGAGREDDTEAEENRHKEGEKPELRT